MNNTCKIIDLEPIGEDEEPVSSPERICRKPISGIKVFLNRVIRRNDGQTLVEYVLIISLVSILLIVSLGNLGASAVFNFAQLVGAL